MVNLIPPTTLFAEHPGGHIFQLTHPSVRRNSYDIPVGAIYGCFMF